MNIRKIFILLLVLIIEQSVFAQVMRNHGKIVVSGGHMVISGNYQNESTGGIVLNGTIQVTGNWTNNGTTNVIETPGTDGEVVFNGTGTQTIGGTSSNVFDFEKITINSGSATEVQAGMGVTAYGACTFTDPLILKSTTTAFRPLTATFINESTVTGNISMELSYTSTGFAAAGLGRGLYFSSPVSNATAGVFDVETVADSNLLWYQDEVQRKYVKVTSNATALTVAKGYILRTPTSEVFTFTGTPNTAASYSNNSIPRAVTGQYYLFGNPYSSVVDWDNMTKTNLSSTIWFNTSTTDGTMVVDTWNSASSVGTNRNGTAFVDGNIAPMQSFWVQCTDVGLTGSLTVSQSNRSHDWGTAPFIKKAIGKSTDKDIFRIYLNTGANLQDETIVLQSESAEDGFGEWDSRKMLLKDGKRGELYTLSPEKINLVIQSFTPVNGDKEIKLGFYAPIAGEYKITTNFDKFQFNQNVYLVDKLLNSTQDLFVNPEYTFTSDAKDDTARFVLRFASAPKVVVSNSISACAPQVVDLTSEAVTFGSDEGLTFSYWTDPKATTAYLTPENAAAGTYFIKGTASNGSYFIAGPIDVTINPQPKLAVNSPSAVCEPQTVDLTSVLNTEESTVGLTYTYWTDKDATIPLENTTLTNSGTFYVKGTTDAGCYVVSEPIVVKINPKPNLVINNPAAVCEPLTVDLTTEAITNGSTSGLQFTYWTDANATVSYITPATASTGNYYIKGVDENGCSSISGPVAVTVNPKPSVVLTNPAPVAYPATVDITNAAITFGSTQGLLYSYWLDSNATLTYSTPQTATAGDYFIKGTVDITGCFTIAGPLTVTITTNDNVDLLDQMNVYSYDKNIVFENCSENSIVSIYDITGKNIYNGTVKSRNEVVPVNINTGIYLINVRSAQSVKSFKVLLR